MGYSLSVTMPLAGCSLRILQLLCVSHELIEIPERFTISNNQAILKCFLKFYGRDYILQGYRLNK